MTRRHVHWPGADLPMTTYTGAALDTPRQLFTDHQGSVVAFADAGGANVGVNSYDEYGIPDLGNTGRFQYTGQIWLDELGMYHYKARIYSPTLGRFMQIDPVGYEDGPNLYAYVGNDPMNARDPTGQTCRRDNRSGDYRCRVDNVDRARLNATQRTQLGRIEREYTRAVNRLMSLPNNTIQVGPSGRAPHNGAPLGAFRITRREAADNLIRRIFSYRPGDKIRSIDDTAYTRGTVGPFGRGTPVTNLTDRGLEIGNAITAVHEGALHGSAQEYRGGLLYPHRSLLGEEPYRSGHQTPYRQASCQLLDEC